MAQIAIWIVVQKLSKKSVPQLIAYGKQVTSLMKGPVPQPPGGPNQYFIAPNPLPANPTLAEMNTALDALQTAFNLPSGKDRTAAIKVAKKDVLTKIRALATYVQLVANLPANVAIGDVVILSAGMEFKKQGTRGKVEDLTVKNHPVQSGDVLANDKRFKKGTVYGWFVKKKTDINFPPSAVWYSTAAEYTYTGLTSAVKYDFQVQHWFTDGTTSMSVVQELPVT